MLFVHHSDISPYLGAGPNVSAHPWKPKEQPKPASKSAGDDFETEWDDVLKQATEEELVDLAGNYLQGWETSGLILISGLTTFILSMKFHIHLFTRPSICVRNNYFC